jgi:PKD repeat protein
MNTRHRSARIRIDPAVVAAGLTLCSPSFLTAEVKTYNDETAYQIALLQLGYGMVREGFEDDATWGAVRTTIVDGAMTAASVTSQRVTWMHNFPASPGNRITTGSGAARTGDYGFFALPHGNYSSPAPCTVPGECGDGFTGSLPAGTSMFGVGGWIRGSHGAKLGVFLDGAALSTGLNDETVTSAAKFFGVIDTAGFNKFEFRELEGKKEDQKFLWADDFTIGLTDEGCGGNSPPTAAFTLLAADPEVTFTDASSDTDGMIVQRLWDFGDGNSSTQQNPSHTYASNGTYPVIIYVLDNDNCAAASLPQLILITSHPPTDVAIENPTNGATVSGTITLEVMVTDPPEEIEHVTYFLDGEEFDNSEEAPFSLSWDTTSILDGLYTLTARLTPFDDIETLSDPVTFSVLNSPPTPLEIWRGQNFTATDLGDPAKEVTVWGNDADPDRDGNCNGKEYALGGAPLDPTDANLHTAGQVTTGPGGETVLELTYWQRSNDPALIFIHEVSSDLQSWSSGPAHTVLVSVIPVDAEIDQITFRGTGLGESDGRSFGRVGVTGP